MSLKFRLATVDDADACNGFQAQLLRRSRTREQWLWEFHATAPHRPILYALAEDNGTIVASQALIRVPMVQPEGPLLTGKGEDTLIHPRYWGKDVLRALFDLLISNASKENIEVLWGFNSSRPVFEKIGFSYLSATKFSYMLRPLNGPGLTRIALFDRHGNKRPARRARTWKHRIASNSFLAAAASKALSMKAGIGSFAQSRPRNTVIKAARPTAQDLNALMTRFVSSNGFTTVQRTTEYMSWRLWQNPWSPSTSVSVYRDFSLVGFAAFSVSNDGIGTVTDLIVSDTESNVSDKQEMAVTFALLLYICDAIEKRGANIIQAPVFGRDASTNNLAAAARSLGFWEVDVGSRACLMSVDGSSSARSKLMSDKWHFTHLNTEGRDG